MKTTLSCVHVQDPKFPNNEITYFMASYVTFFINKLNLIIVILS